MSPDHLSFGKKLSTVAARLAQLGLGSRRRIRQQRIQQRRLSRAVASHQCNFFTANYARGKVADYSGIFVGLGNALNFQNVLARRPLLLELQEGTLNIGPCKFRDLEALHFFASGLHLARPCAGGESGDKFVQLGNLLFALSILPLDLRTNLRLGDHHVVVRARVRDNGFVIDVGNVSAHAVQKVAIVRDDDQHAVVFIEKTLEPVDRIQIKVVRWFVEQQRLRMSEQSLREKYPHFLAALQLSHHALVQVIGNIQSLQQQRGVGLGGIAIFFADRAFQFAEFHAVFVSNLRLGVNLFTLFHRSPEPLVAHDDGVDHAVGIKSKLVLAQYAELSRTHDSSLLRVEFPREKVHKSRFTGAIGSGQAITLPRREGRGHFVEQNFGAVAHRNITD